MRSDGWGTPAARRGLLSLEKRQLWGKLSSTFLEGLYWGAGDPMVINRHWRFRLDTRKNFSPEDTPAVQRAAQRNRTVSILRGFQDQTGQKSEQPGAAWPRAGRRCSPFPPKHSAIQSQGWKLPCPEGSPLFCVACLLAPRTATKKQMVQKPPWLTYLRQANWQALTNLHKDLVLSKVILEVYLDLRKLMFPSQLVSRYGCDFMDKFHFWVFPWVFH